MRSGLWFSDKLLVRHLGLGGLWSIGENITKKVGESVIIKKILHDMQSAIEARYKQIGDTTISFEEAAQMWSSSNITMSNVKDLIFGNTPAREVLIALVNLLV